MLLLRDATPVPRLLAMGAVATVVHRLGRRAVALHPPDDAEGVAGRRARRARSTTILVVFIVAAIVILPSLGLLYVLDQKSLLKSDNLTTPSQPHG